MIARPFLTRLRRDSRGATTVEYAMVLAFIVLAIITSVRGVADENTGIWATLARRAGEAHGQVHP